MSRLYSVDRRILQGLTEGVEESMKLVCKDENPETGKVERSKPFFMSLILRTTTNYEITAANGAIRKTERNPVPRNSARGDMRVGHYDRGCSVSASMSPAFPSDNNIFAFKRELWEEVNAAIYLAIKDLRNRRNMALATPEEFQPYIYFSKEKPVKYFNPVKIAPPDMDYWEEILRKTSQLLIRDEIIDSSIEFAYEYEKRFYVNSEGTRIVDSNVVARIVVHAAMLGDKNLVFKNAMPFYARVLNKLPSENDLIIAVETLIRELYETRAAPQEAAGTYPTITDNENTGVQIHEAMGHSGEGHRQDETDDDDDIESFFELMNTSLMFKDKAGKKVTPDFLTIYDDPTLLEDFGGYLYDEEGVKAQKVVFIENGILRNFFHSRESAGKLAKKLGQVVRSNGHCRAALIYDPIPRMSNLVIRSTNEHTMEELKEMLFAECRKQGKKYGLLLKGLIGGFTDFEGNYFKVFPKNIFRLYPNGKEKRVRGLYQVSTPYQMLENIVATTGDYKTCNGSCGAESGFVPASETAPDAFIKSVEYGIIPRAAYDIRKPMLSKPPRLHSRRG